MVNLNTVLLVLFVSFAIVQPQFLNKYSDDIWDVSSSENQEVEVVINLHTRKNLENPDQLFLYEGGLTIKKSHFNASHPTRFYITNYGVPGVNDYVWFRNSYLTLGNFNLIMITVDHPNEQKSIPDIKFLGIIAAYTIRLLRDTYGVNPAEITIIGYGIGAHAAGFAGRALKRDGQPLGAIVAIDPFNEVTGEKWLQKTDALYVQTIKTSPFGISEPLGHANFYVNYGLEQPRCGGDHIHCTHPRGHVLFAESLISKPGFVGIKCRSITEIHKKACVSSGVSRRMGGEPLDKKASGIYYVPTHEVPPYAMGEIGSLL